MKVHDLWKTVKQFSSQIETSYDLLRQTYRDPPTHLVLMPTAYRLLTENGKLPVDDGFKVLIGQYLCKRYPELRDQILSDSQKRNISDLRHQLVEFMEEHNETD